MAGEIREPQIRQDQNAKSNWHNPLWETDYFDGLGAQQQRTHRILPRCLVARNIEQGMSRNGCVVVQNVPQFKYQVTFDLPTVFPCCICSILQCDPHRLSLPATTCLDIHCSLCHLRSVLESRRTTVLRDRACRCGLPASPVKLVSPRRHKLGLRLLPGWCFVRHYIHNTVDSDPEDRLVTPRGRA